MGENMFEVGDRVIVVVDEVMDCNSHLGPGSMGTIRCFDGDNPGVEWDKHVDGHTLGGMCENGHGWYVYPTDIALLVDNPEFDVDCDEILSLCGGAT